MYSYVHDLNSWIDPFGLAITPTKTYNPNGSLNSATATVTKGDLGTGTNTNASSRRYARGLGKSNDDAGHIIGKQLGGSGGKGNVFPQNLSKNRGAFAQFEGVVADMIHSKGSAQITVSFEYANGGTRPTGVNYEAVAPDGTVLKDSFKNPCS